MEPKRRRLVAQQEEDVLAAGAPPAAGQEDEDTEEWAWDDVPTDVEATIMLLRGQLRAAAPTMPPVVLHTHLYATLKDRTSVDRQIEQLRMQGKVHVFKLGTDVDEYAVLLSEDYTRLVQSAAASRAQRSQVSSTTPSPAQQQQQQPRPLPPAASHQIAHPSSPLAHLFLHHIVPACKGISVEKEELAALHSRGSSSASRNATTSGTGSSSSSSVVASRQAGAASSDQFLSDLLAAELLARDPITPGQFLFTIPGAGGFMGQLVAGRQELLGLVAKKRYREALEREVLGRKLRRSRLGMRFHIRDAVCRGALTRTDTPAGAVLRVARPA